MITGSGEVNQHWTVRAAILQQDMDLQIGVCSIARYMEGICASSNISNTMIEITST